MTRSLLGACAVLVALIAPEAALAHGLSGEAANKTTLEFVPLGIEHMLLGWDHLLFILGVVLFAGQLNRAAKLITTFVLGHSLTLMLASFMDWRVSPTFVDIVIALSVVTIAVLGLRGRPKDWTPIYFIVGGFGLVHGFGLGTRLLELGLPDDGIFGKVLMFNLGLEIGQLIAIGIVVALLYGLARVLRDGLWVRVRQALYAGMATAGLVAAMLLTLPDGASDPEPVAAQGTPAAEAACTQVDEQLQPSLAGTHPDKQFYGPGEPVVEENLGHIVGDGYAIVRYSDDLTSGQVEQLRAMIDGSGKAVAGAEDPAQEEPVTVTTAFRRLTCERFDAQAVATFNEEWFAELRARGVGG